MIINPSEALITGEEYIYFDLYIVLLIYHYSFHYPLCSAFPVFYSQLFTVIPLLRLLILGDLLTKPKLKYSYSFFKLL